MVRLPLLLETMALLITLALLLFFGSSLAQIFITTIFLLSLIFLLVVMLFLVLSTPQARSHSYLLRFLSSDEYTRLLKKKMVDERQKWEKGLIILGTAIFIVIINGLLTWEPTVFVAMVLLAMVFMVLLLVMILMQKIRH